MDFKSYFQQPYQGGESFIENVIIPIFGESKFEDGYEEDIIEGHPELETVARATGITQILRLGTINIPMNPTDVFDITVSDRVQMERNRVAIQQLVRRIMSTYSSAFMIFHYDDDDKWDWRFSYSSKQSSNKDTTESKRYTFLLGPNQSCRTAAENFDKLAAKGGRIERADIIAAFDVEALSKEFFGKYKAQYEKFCQFVYEHKTDREWFGPEFEQWEDKQIRDYVKRLLGRIVFLHFLQKKGWMGVPTDKEWGEGHQQFMKDLFDQATPAQQANYLDEVLEPLFADALDTDRTASGDLFDTHVPGIDVVKVPYLNGGLFEKDEMDEPKSVFPAEYFKALFQFFYEYNFTIDENDPDDAQVGVDPEMLGRIFENLLEDNKDKGAFYTPKEIVQYMCRESLIAYLQTDLTDEATREALRTFVTYYDASVLGGATSALAAQVSELLKAVKICDPAIGSGAFPMGLLRELFLCRSAIEGFERAQASAIKRHIIQQNIYGVDIEKGAVDIARLRFWLTLILDEETPHALPNLDFKIMQGNSLLEQYQGIDLTLVAKTKNERRKHKLGDMQLTWFEADIDVTRRQLKEMMKEYYSCEDHARRSTLRDAMAANVKSQIQSLNGALDLSNINVAANSDFFLWHTWFADVFEEGGFDIVIGNPPYIQLQANEGFLSSIYNDKGFETFESTGDIFSLFYEQGWSLLRDKGCLCYITSNKWMRNNSGEKTRDFFAKKTNPLLLLNFEDIQLFDNATVETNILLFSKEDNCLNTLAVVTDNKANDILRSISDYVRNHFVYMSFADSNSWVVLSKAESTIMEKIKGKSTLLKDWNIDINFGLKTGYNTAFLIDGITRSSILDRCITEEERYATEQIIRPVLRGRDVKRYEANWSDFWIINTHNGIPNKLAPIDIEDYPSLRAYLLTHWDRISRRSDKGRTPFNLRNCAYVLDFAKPKIVWGEISDRSKFCYDEEGQFYCEATTFFMTGDISTFLLCYLNSKLAEYLFSKIATTTGMGTVRWKKYKIEQLLVPYVSEQVKQQVDSLYRRYLSSKQQSALDEIDRLVYDLYGLTEEEIAIVEGQQ